MKTDNQMKINKCFACSTYTMKSKCPKCGEKTGSAHYKFLKIKNVKPAHEQ